MPPDLEWRQIPRRAFFHDTLSMRIRVTELSLSVVCDLRWEPVPAGLIEIRCGPPEHEAPRMYFYGQLVGLNGEFDDRGGLSHTHLTVKDRRYGARGKWGADGRLVYTFTPATIDPDTNALVYDPRAAAVAAASFDHDDVSIGVKNGTADAKELALAARVLVTVALIGLNRFSPYSWPGAPSHSQLL